MRPFTGKRAALRLHLSSLLTIFIFAAGAFVLALPFGVFNTQASGTISGIVFQDFNGNGTFETSATIANSSGTGTVGTAIDSGVAGVEVRAYDSAGNNATTGGVVTSDAGGNYSLTATGTGPYRIEFTNIPAGYNPSARSTDSVQGGTATNSGTTVQFVLDGTTGNVNLALDRPEEYCQNNPNLLTARLEGGAQNGANAAQPTINSFPYSAGTSYTDATAANYDSPSTHTVALTASQTGPVFGLAFARKAQRIYAASFFKKYAGFGPGANGTYNEGGASSDDPGAIYVINPATSAVVTTLTVPNTGTNSHNVSDYNADNGDTAVNAVGKTSLGGIAVSDDESALYVMNLQNRTLYSLNPTTGATIASQAVPTSGVPTPGGSAANCAAADVRPFAVRYYRGQVYVGMVCSAESTGNVANLRAYVYTADPATLAFGASPAFQAALNYNRGTADPGWGAEWQAWRATGTSDFAAPQPMLTDLEFDKGNLILALRDRAGDQSFDNGTNAKRTAGDTLRACGSAGSWTLESNGRCGGTGNAIQSNGQGPGEGEFYYEDEFSTGGNTGQFHDEITWGSIVQIPGDPNVVVAGLDPIDRDVSSQTFDGGFRWFNNTTGATNKAYRIYNGTGSAGVPDFGKVNGLGDIVALCDPAPIEIGNRVWLDSNANGVQDAGENGISGVTAHLFNSANTQIGTAVTDTNGEYYFVSSAAADGNTTDNIGQINGGISTGAAYQVRFDLAANYNAGGPLNGRFLTAVNSGFQNGAVDGSDSDAGNVVNPTGSPAGTFPVISLTTGSAGDNDHTFDAGFSATSTYSIGNRVWYDTDNDGRVDAGEAGINGVSVSLFADSNSDGAPDTPGTPVGSVTTAGGGYYRFDSLAAGTYVVRINSTNFDNSGDVLYGYQNTSGNVTADTDSTATSSGENGINPAGAANSVQTGGILSNTITLGAGVSEPVGESDLSASGQGSPDGFADMTVDFGFYRLCVGNLVFNDMGAGVNRDNGNFDSGEIGRASVRIRLYNAAGTEIPVGPDGILGTADDAANGLLTDSGGNYQFCGMPQGTYRGAVFPGGPNSSTPTDATPDDNKDSDDNGAPTGVAIGSIPATTIVSSAVTLTPGSAGALSANTVTNSTGSTINPTLDFGLVVSPTAVKMAEFRAEETKDGTGLSWQSSFEANNLGYRVWRDGAGGRELIGKDLIAGSALQVGDAAMTAGSEYRVLDGSTKNSGSQGASYWLEAVDLDGSSEWFGPVTPVTGENRYRSDNFTRFAPTFSDLNANSSLLQTEYIERVPKSDAANSGDENSSKAANQFAADSSVLKIKVNRSGWYHIDAADLAANGFDLSRSAAWHLSAGGNEEAMLAGDDGSVEFYGRGLDAPYSDTRVYWLSVGQSGARRIKSSKLEFDPNAQAGLSSLTVERQDRPVRASSILNGDRENWYAAIVNTTESVSNLTLNNLAADSVRMAKLSVNLQGLNAGEHRVAVTLNGSEIGQVSIDSMGRSEWQMDISAAQLREGQNQIGVRSLNGSADVSLLETVSIDYPRNLKAVDDRVEFRNEPGRSVKLTGFTGDQVRVFDVTDPAKATMFLALPNAEADGTFSISVPAMSSARSLLAQGDDRMLAPVSIERNSNSSLRASGNRADFVIIAPAQFHGQLAALQAKRESEGLRTMLVDVEDVFDEFGFGMRNPQAVKDFLQYARANWATKPGYVLLVGDASADPRNYSGLGGAQADLVPTMWFDTQSMTASSDELLVDQNGDGIGEMSIGRLPVRTQDDLSAVLAKILSFDPLKSSAANERGALTVADSSTGYDFAGGNQNLRGMLPADMSVAAVNRADGDTAQVRQQVIDRMNAGPLMVNFFGHGSTGIWTSGGIFRLDDASALTNEQRPSLVTMLTCLNGAFAEQNETMSEVLLKARHGGAFAAFSFSSMNYPDVQEAMAGAWYRSLIGGSRLGDAARSAKASYDHLDTRYTLTLFGDPTQRVVKTREK